MAWKAVPRKLTAKLRKLLPVGAKIEISHQHRMEIWTTIPRGWGCCIEDRPSLGTTRSLIRIRLHGRLIAAIGWEEVAVGRRLLARGTFVDDRWRKKGLAAALWELVLARVQPKAVKVIVISDKGMTLVSGLAEKHKSIVWMIIQDGERPLRKLRKGKGRAA